MALLKTIERAYPCSFLSVGTTLKHCLSFLKIQPKEL
ncbi:hypothetical protein PSFL111601_22985 [Pseudomonas floridensis]